MGRYEGKLDILEQLHSHFKLSRLTQLMVVNITYYIGVGVTAAPNMIELFQVLAFKNNLTF